MRVSLLICSLLVAGSVRPSDAQSVEVQGSAGPTLVNGGYSAAAGVGWAPWSRLTVAVNVEHTHLFTRETRDRRGGTTAFRGGDVTLGVVEARLSLRPRDRVGPYLLAGAGGGVSRPSVSPAFPEATRNTVRGLFAGAGLQVPLRPRLRLFGDVRMTVGDERGELLALVPLRLGLAWRF